MELKVNKVTDILVPFSRGYFLVEVWSSL